VTVVKLFTYYLLLRCYAVASAYNGACDFTDTRTALRLFSV